jgi:tRNA pseudouridine38-40 synthase
MPRYFLEVAYKGGNYSGFQVQKNANTVQAEIEKALETYFRQKVTTTGSSRTDTGVHALQNFFHFDFEETISYNFLYSVNSILPFDIAVKNIYFVPPNANCRFDAVSREYRYYIYQKKDPFIYGRAYYFPYALDLKKLLAAAEIVASYKDFTAFSKRNTQVKNFECSIIQSTWIIENDCVIYHVHANRFLRGMVRGLVGTMLQVGRDKLSLDEFEKVIQGRDCTKADFSAPGEGLFLVRVNYPENLLTKL